MKLLDLFDRHVADRPDAIAVIFHQGQRLSYHQLDIRANRLANWLLLAMQPEESPAPSQGQQLFIPFCLRRSTDQIAMMIAILRLGGAYVPLDPNAPPARNAHILSDLKATFVVADSTTKSSMQAILQGPSWSSPCPLENVIDIDQSQDRIESMTTIRPKSIHNGDFGYVMYTSGSTGQPKGVLVRQQAILNLLHETNYIKIGPEDRFFQGSSLAFDAATFDIWGALLNGAACVLSSKSTVMDSNKLAKLLLCERVTIVFLTSALFNQHVQADPAIFGALKYVLFGGEAASNNAVCRLWDSNCRPEHLYNMYGPTENTVFSTFYPIKQRPEKGRKIPIGKPITGVTYQVVDSELKPVPEGSEGELLLGGSGLAAGYLNLPELSAQRFVNSDTGWYRSGDLVKVNNEKDIIFMGRIDNQVKVRGFRVELGEIELALESHPDILEAIILTEDDMSGTLRFLAYMRPKDQLELPKIDSIQSHLEYHLPPYMIPSSFRVINEFPLGTTGKVDRRQLKKVTRYKVLKVEQNLVQPRSLVESELREIWAQHLDLDPWAICIHANFFKLGGHSLLAVALVRQISQSYQNHFNVCDFLNRPSISQMASLVKEAESRCVNETRIPVQSRVSELPLSWAQELIWMHQQRAPDRVFYNEPLNITMPEAIDVTSFQKALQSLLERHQSLRTKIEWRHGQVSQYIASSIDLPFTNIDLRHMPGSQRFIEANRLATNQAKQAFDLSGEALLRCLLVRLEDDRYRLYITGHHLVLDGVGMFKVFVPELELAYRAYVQSQPLKLNPFDFEWSDWLFWQREKPQREHWQKQLDYWSNHLADFHALDLPTDRTDTTGNKFDGHRIQLRIDAATTASLKQLARNQETSLFVVLLSAFQTMLFRYTHETDIAVNSVVAGRTTPGMEQHVCLALNTLILRTQVPSDGTFLDLLHASRKDCLEAFANQDVPFQLVLQRCRQDHGWERDFQVQCGFVFEPGRPESPGGWEIDQLEVHTDTAKFDLTFELDECNDQIIGRVEYRTQIFDAITIQRMIHHYHQLLDAITKKPTTPLQKLPLMSVKEKQQILIEWNQTEVNYDAPPSLHELVARRAAETPDALAIIDSGGFVTFCELIERAHGIAHFLHAIGVGSGDLVGVWTDRCAEHIIAQLGVLQAGAAFVPIGTNEPLDRVRKISKDAAIKALIYDYSCEHRAHEVSVPGLLMNSLQREKKAPKVTVSGKDPAYVIYTSGSTGRPKGVVVDHESIVDRTLWAQAYFRYDQKCGMLHTFSLAFDGSLISTWVVIGSGATCIMPNTEQLESPAALAELITRHNVSHLCATPTFLTLLIGFLRREQIMLEWCGTGGEKLSPELVKQMRLISRRVANLYGPTEGTILATYWEDKPQSHQVLQPPIGKPIANTKVYVLDQALQPAPSVGELYIGGIGVANRYLGMPTRTALSFVNNPFGPGRLYRTGDMARWSQHGELLYLGRVDQQVKIRGFRVELGEIESAIRKQSNVNDCAVMIREDRPGKPILAAYVVLASKAKKGLGGVRAELEQKLPPHMVPTTWTQLQTLPQTKNGKIDIRALPKPSNAINKCLTSPRNIIESTLHDIWCKVLKMSEICLDQDFWALGGDSLSALQLIALANDEGLAFRLKDLYEHRSIAAVSLFLARQKHSACFERRPPQPLTSAQPPLVGDCPLLPIQHWFFEQGFDQPHHWNQGFCFTLRHRIIPNRMNVAFENLVRSHDVLRLRTRQQASKWSLEFLPSNDPQARTRFEVKDLTGLASTAQKAVKEENIQRLHGELNHSNGPVLTAAIFDTDAKKPQTLWIAVHHLFIDGYSWSLLSRDLAYIYQQLGESDEVSPPQKSCSVRQWAMHLKEYANCQAQEDFTYWYEQLSTATSKLGDIDLSHPGITAVRQVISRELDQKQTHALLRCLPKTAKVDSNAILLTALGVTLNNLNQGHHFTVWLEGHGREQIHNQVDLSRTMGWLTSLFPFSLPMPNSIDLSSYLHEVAQKLAEIPQRGLSYLALRYLTDNAEIRKELKPTKRGIPLLFNYLSSIDTTDEGLLQISKQEAGLLHGSINHRVAALELNSFVQEGRFSIEWAFNGACVPVELISRLADDYMKNLLGLANMSYEKALEFQIPSSTELHQTIFSFRQGGRRRPLFLIHPAGSSAMCYAELAGLLSKDQPVYGLECVSGYQGKSIPSLAAEYIEAIRGVQPQGPYLIGGWSLGGIIAHEMVLQLEKQGEVVAAQVHLDSRPTTHERQKEYSELMHRDLPALLALLTRHLEKANSQPLGINYEELRQEPQEQLMESYLQKLESQVTFPLEVVRSFVPRFVEDFRGALGMLTEGYQDENPGVCEAPIHLFRASDISRPHPGFVPLEEPMQDQSTNCYGWSRLTRSSVTVYPAPGNHETFVFQPHVEVLAQNLEETLSKLQDAY